MKRSVSAIDWASAACRPRPVMAAANGSWDSSLLHTKSVQKEGGREGADTQLSCHTQSSCQSSHPSTWQIHLPATASSEQANTIRSAILDRKSGSASLYISRTVMICNIGSVTQSDDN